MSLRAVGSSAKGEGVEGIFREFLPPELPAIDDLQTAIPKIAKDERLVAAIARAVRRIPTTHKILLADAREMTFPENSIHLVLTSPPYWTLKEYRQSASGRSLRMDMVSRLSIRSWDWSW